MKKLDSKIGSCVSGITEGFCQSRWHRIGVVLNSIDHWYMVLWYDIKNGASCRAVEGNATENTLESLTAMPWSRQGGN